MKGKQVWFTSDLHFGHEAVIKYCNRPFENVEDMRERLIRNWNSVVQDNDLVYVLGDFSMYLKKPELIQILSRLKGTKVLVTGNHDQHSSYMLNSGFHAVVDQATIRIAGEEVIMSHYPYSKGKLNYWFYYVLNKLMPRKFFRPRYFKQQLNHMDRFLLHGHTHNKNVVNGKMIHVGTDAHNYKPISMSKIANIITEIKRQK